MLRNKLMFVRVLPILILLFLSGCKVLTTQSTAMPFGASPLTTVAGAELLSVISTQKTMGDHIVSKVTGLDCSTPRSQLDKGSVCREKPLPPQKRPQVYCYRSLATPDCYVEPSKNITDVRVGYPLY